MLLLEAAGVRHFNCPRTKADGRRSQHDRPILGDSTQREVIQDLTKRTPCAAPVRLARTSSTPATRRRALNAVPWVLQILLAIMFAMAGLAKVFGESAMVEMFAEIGLVLPDGVSPLLLLFLLLFSASRLGRPAADRVPRKGVPEPSPVQSPPLIARS